MNNIDLSTITEDHIKGQWHVLSNAGGDHKTNTVFRNLKNIEFLPTGTFKSDNGKLFTGSWQIVKQNEMIYNPQVMFNVQEEEVARAIITRLYNVKKNDRMTHLLVLYFNTGLEVVLQNFIEEPAGQ